MENHPLAKIGFFSPSSSGHSPASSCDEFLSRSAASFVFVEETVTLSRHSTVVHIDDNPVDLLVGENKQALLYNVGAEETLLVTNYRMILYKEDLQISTEIPLASILDLKSKYGVEKKLSLDIKTKDCRFFQFVCRDVVAPQSILKLLAELVFKSVFGRERIMPKLEFVEFFWSLEKELDRMDCIESFQVFSINKDFSLCATYPRDLVFPRNVSEQVLIGAAKFRDKGRLPVFCWSSAKTATIFRSSQPRSSLLNRSLPDEELMKSMDIQCIVDCRPMLNAYANIANGAGVESLGNYHAGIELWFGSIPNIHHVRDSWEKMFLLSQQLPSNWFTGLEQTGWYDNLSLILRAVVKVVEKIFVEKKNVLCRCSHGLDRTPQVVSLAMIAMDSYYRTIEGLAVLIEKEWVRMGHRFVSRFALGTSPTDEMSPIFFQFLESLFQIMIQFPTAFEFNPEYLVLILQAVVAGRFETFLFDCEADKLDKQNSDESAWPAIWKHKNLFVNKAFEKTDERLLIEPHVSQMKVFSQVWLKSSRTII